MNYAGWIIGLLGFGSFAGLCFWLVGLGKKIKQGDIDKEKIITLEAHQKGIKRWIKTVDDLLRRKDELKKAASDAHDRGDLGGILRSLSESRKPIDPAPKKTDAAN